MAIVLDSDSHKTDEIWVIKFDEASAQKFRERVMSKAKQSDKDPIVIYIDSYGGEVDALAKMIETLDEVRNPIITVCMGKAMSCGAVLLSHGDIRFIGRHSRTMVHEVSSWTAGNVHDIKADSEETTRLNEYFMGLLARNCNIKEGYAGLRKIMKGKDGRDLYLDAKETVKFGLADQVGVPKLIDIMFHEAVVVPEKKRKPLKPATKTVIKTTKKKKP
jgi:ATP-dependent Clp protease protease subunit